MLKITAYAERLLNDLEGLEWPEKVKKMQADWIGKSYGAEIDFNVEGMDKSIKVFTTRPDTLYGEALWYLLQNTQMYLNLLQMSKKQKLKNTYLTHQLNHPLNRMTDKEKTGVFLGRYAVNPLNGNKLPIWISDYVLADYGTGAIMCVPAHDERDFAFAKKFELPIIQVISKTGEEETLEEAYTEEGIMINSGDFNGMKSSEAKVKIQITLNQKILVRKQQTINFVAGYSHVNATGVNQFQLYTVTAVV